MQLIVIIGYLPTLCTSCACGHTFTIEHALSCPKGESPSLRHNEIRDVTASLLSEVCNNVATEPHLQPPGEVLLPTMVIMQGSQWFLGRKI